MKVVHVPFCFYPDPVAGTEIYVNNLAHALAGLGIESVIAAPAQREEEYLHEGLLVRRFSCTRPTDDLSTLYGGDPAAPEEGFARILGEVQPDLLHLHAFTSDLSPRLLREAKAKRIPVVFSFHTATVGCQRGTLLRWGKEACDGVLRLDLCTRCTLHGLGVPRVMAEWIGRVPTAAGAALGAARLSGGVWTALRMRALMKVRHAATQVFFEQVDHIIALAEWTRELLIRNGIPERKITLCRHGLAETRGELSPPKDDDSSKERPVRILFLGRIHPVKGVEVLVRSLVMGSNKELPVIVNLRGIIQGPSDATYLQQLQAIAAGDSRIRFQPPVPAGQVGEVLRGCDIIAVPSVFMETGPLVVLEAFAAGIPVIGSRLGGIAELVQDGVNGLLVEPGSVEAWSAALRRLCEDRQLLTRLRRGIRPPRLMGEVAREMRALYESLLA